MYPDTDTPPLPIAESTVAAIRAALPEHPVNREARYRGLGLGELLARRLARSPWTKRFEEAVPADGAMAGRLAWFVVDRMPHHRRQAGAPPLCDASRMQTVVAAVTSGEVRPEALTRMLDAAVGEADTAPDQIVDRFRQAGEPDELFLATVERSAGQARALEGRLQDTRLRWAMGDAMQTLLGRADPKGVWSHLAEALGIEHEEVSP